MRGKGSARLFSIFEFILSQKLRTSISISCPLGAVKEKDEIVDYVVYYPPKPTLT